MPKIRELSLQERETIFIRRNQGETLQKIANDYRISKEGVKKIVKKIADTGSAENCPRTGRPRKTTPREDRKILLEVNKNPFITSRELKENLKLPIGSTQIKQRLHEAQLHGRVARKKPFISAVNARKRLEFAKAHLNKPLRFWETVLWSDESKFEIKSNKRRHYVWRRTGQAFEKKFITPTVKHGGGSIMVWGCFSREGTGNLHVVEGKMTAVDYINILKTHMLESVDKLGLMGSYIFQQDNDPKHTAKIVKNFFDTNGINVLPWPPQSPDLNPIEHLWEEIDRKIPQRVRDSKIRFLTEIQKVWSEIPDETIKKLIDSIPNRLQEVIAAKGYHTKY